MLANEGANAAPLIPTRFVWPHGGRHVHLCGSFTRWRESLPMTPVDGAQNVFQVVCSLPPGYHQYKFIVDSEWRHDENQAYMPDPLGNVNNWLLVREPQSISGSHTPAGPSLSHDGQAPRTYPESSPQLQATGITMAVSASVQGMVSVPVPIPGSGAGSSMEVDPMEVGQHSSTPHSHPQPLTPLHVPQPMVHSGQPSPQPLRQHSIQGLPGGTASIMPDAVEAISAADAEASRQRIVDFLSNKCAHELLPESGKVVALDVALPVKQAFHALYEQGVPAAPLWDSERCAFVGMLSASDFITIIKQLRSSGAELSEEELETHSIAAWKEAKLSLASSEDAAHTPARRPLIHVGPDDTLRHVAELLLRHSVATVPILHHEPPPGSPPLLLHLASLSGILKCVARHFRHVAGSLPLLSQPVGALPLGTWSPGTGRAGRKQLATLRAHAPLTHALSLLLSEGVSSLPVVDESGALLDVYARSDITALARERAYARLQLDDMTVTEALRYRQDATTSVGALGAPGGSAARCHMCLHSDTLRSVIERLAHPGARRVICVEAGSRRVEGIISLTDVFQFLLAA